MKKLPKQQQIKLSKLIKPIDWDRIDEIGIEYMISIYDHILSEEEEQSIPISYQDFIKAGGKYEQNVKYFYKEMVDFFINEYKNNNVYILNEDFHEFYAFHDTKDIESLITFGFLHNNIRVVYIFPSYNSYIISNWDMRWLIVLNSNNKTIINELKKYNSIYII